MNKLTIISLAALLLLCAISAAVLTAINTAEEQIPQPEKNVTVLLEDRGEIITVSYREYITGCLFGLTSPKYESEALKAVAAAVNTTARYVQANRSTFMYSGADFSDSIDGLPFITADEAEALYGDSYSKYLARLDSAAESGIETLITYEGEPIFAAVCEISSGSTDNAADVLGNEYPYLNSIELEKDTECEDYESFRLMTPQGVFSALNEICTPSLTANYTSWFSNAEYLDSGTLRTIDYGGCELTGAELRDVLGLRSAAVSVEYTEDKFKFTCLGYGSNLGMSLNSADSLALQGYKMEEILMYFYDGVKIESDYISE